MNKLYFQHFTECAGAVRLTITAKNQSANDDLSEATVGGEELEAVDSNEDGDTTTCIKQNGSDDLVGTESRSALSPEGEAASKRPIARSCGQVRYVTATATFHFETQVMRLIFRLSISEDKYIS